MKVSTFIKKLDALKEQLQQVPGSTIIHTDGRDGDKEFKLAVKYLGYFDWTKQEEIQVQSNYNYFLTHRSEFPKKIELVLKDNER